MTANRLTLLHGWQVGWQAVLVVRVSQQALRQALTQLVSPLLSVRLLTAHVCSKQPRCTWR